jgi:peptidoglycan/xylan/chitin deacetylase (PgdA/CDA1 family)
MYHELALPQRALASADPGYDLYCVPRDAFRAQLEAIAAAGLRGASLGETWARSEGHVVAITFDDGCETDWMEAAPLLCARGFGATFFVVAGFVGRRGYLTQAQLRDLAAAGFEVGSHSLSHRMLTTVTLPELEREIVDSRASLEDLCGAPVRHFSCPHGRWSSALARLAREAGYETVSTSRVGLNGPTTHATRLRRIAVQRGVDAESVAALAQGHGMRRLLLRDAALRAAKGIVGDAAYASCRRHAMRLLGGARRRQRP